MSTQSSPPPPPKRRASPDQDPEQLIGQLIAGRYVIEKCIGRGGMGVVYLARQNNLNRQVVIKVLRSGLVDDAEAMARFEREAQGLSLLQHPNIVTIHDFGHEEDRAYIIMEFIEGETITKFMRREGPMRLGKFIQIAAQILEGIAAAHDRGLLHRDIKPANLMLVKRGDSDHFVKILDFGLAKLNNGESDVTREQTLVGSAAFMAPEQIVGLEISEAVDVYALGVLFYYMLTGKRPFSAPNDTAMLYKHVHEAPEPLEGTLPIGHDIPDAIIHLVHQCLSKNPKQRPANAGALLEALTAEVTGASKVQMPWSRTDLSAISTSSSTSSPSMPGIGGSMSLSVGMLGQSAPSMQGVSGASLTFVRTSDGQIHQVVPIDGTSQSFSKERPLLITTQPKSLWLPALLVVALLGCVGLIVYLLVGRQSTSPSAGAATPGSDAATTETHSPQPGSTLSAGAPTTAPTPPPPTQPDPAAEEAALSAQLDRIDAQVAAEAFGDADTALDLINERDLGRFPTQQARAVQQRKHIKLSQLSQRAARRERDGDLDGAISTWEEVLAINAADAAASDHIQRLQSLKKANERGTLTVTLANTVSDARVKIDGVTLESDLLPLRQELPPGVYHYRVEAEGFKTAEGDVVIESGQANSLALTLDKQRKASSNTNKSGSGGLLPAGNGKQGNGLLPVGP
jgi:eukaryotic-like serine/threonine-protein kinase